ncbi:MAG: polysaccharide ABC transporter ATP-binding protein [Patescibacteria group bacterium]
MKKPIIEVKNIGKKYDIQHERGRYVALRDVLTNVAKSPLSFLANKAKKAVGLEKKEEFWALKDINFTVEKGEVIGIIGPNGAGKSTLLKILSQITPPTTGEIILRGRVGSLLEVGTGFHPELTGRENIFLNGAILGMKHHEIATKFDEIVEFAGIEKFLDTPVKHYSSGMYVRLAFSVAAHMEPDILLVDEVLAVGDAEFQKKCLGKMGEITKQGGRTILFVSHNMGAIQELCDKAILIEGGVVKKIGLTKKVISEYLNKSRGEAITELRNTQNREDKGVKVTRVSILRENNIPSTQIPVSEPFSIKIEYKITIPTKSAEVSLAIYREGGLLLLSSGSDKNGQLFDFQVGSYETQISVPSFLFNVGEYLFDIIIHKPMTLGLDHVQKLFFEITDINNPRSAFFPDKNSGQIASILDHVTKKIKETIK